MEYVSKRTDLLKNNLFIILFLPLDALSQTTEWLKESIDEEFLSETAVTPGTEQSPPPSLSPLLVLNNSYLKLLQWDYQTKVLPEVSGSPLHRYRVFSP